MFEKLKAFLGRSQVEAPREIDAASQLAPLAPPKVRKGSRGFPSFFTSVKPDARSSIPKSDRRLASSSTLDLRNGQNTNAIIRDFAAASPDLSSAVWAYLRVGIPEKYTAKAYSAVDGTFDRDATQLLQQILVRMDVLTPYEDGFSNIQSLKSVSESLAKELILYGAMAGELVLDKGALPSMIQPISTTTIEFKYDKKGLKPLQRIGQDEIDLDTPTFVYLSLDQDLLDAYASSPMESAIKPVLFKEDFAQDLHRIIKKVVHPRQKVTINEEQFRKFMSPEAQNDPEVAAAEMSAVVAELENQVNNLSPEDALVFFDSIGFEVEGVSGNSTKQEYEILQGIGNSRLAAGAKTLGTVLGFQGGSSNIASSEVMLFMKSADGAVRQKLNQFYSRMFTLALRLFGLDVYVKFEYAPIDLRPQAELSAFNQTEQMMVLEQLSLGMITDDEASLRLNGKLPPAGAPQLSGTMFHLSKGGGGGQSADESSNNGSTLNQNLNSDAPSTARGQNKRANAR